ncbi:MAG: zinc-dependent metalloprotease [Pirellulaceae bacterium]|nr:zinc-dependent metalloprotease [Pirellulaceae bacterium]
MFVALSACLLAVLAAVGSESRAETITIENGGRVEFSFSLRVRPGLPWSKPFELEPGQRYTVEASEPVVVSYWTDQARFATLQPGTWYRIDDPRNGPLRPVTGAMRPPRAEKVEPPASAPDSGTASAGDDGVRKVRLSAIADATYRQVVDDWRERIRQTVAGASKYYEANFRVRLELDEIRAWEYRGLADDVQGRVKRVLQESPGSSDLLIAFVGLGDYYKTDEKTFLTGHLGSGFPFGQHLLVTGNDDFHVNREIAVLIHELAHAFGAFHVTDRKSLMQPGYDDAPLREVLTSQLPLDAVSMEIIGLTREVDFRSGVASLDAATQRRIKHLAFWHRHSAEAHAMSPIALGHAYQFDRSVAQAIAEATQSPPSSPADNSFKAGDRVEVTAETVPLMVEDVSLAEIPRGTTLDVQYVLEDRLLVEWQPAYLKGQIRADQLVARFADAPLRHGQILWTAEEAELLHGSRVLSTLPRGVRVMVQSSSGDLVLVTVEKQNLAQFMGANLLFEPCLQGWIDRTHVRPISSRTTKKPDGNQVETARSPE